MKRITLSSLVTMLLCLASAAFADTITLTSSGLPATTLGPSSDTFALNAGSTVISGLGSVIFQTGNLSIGDSQIPDQIIPFFFYETITLNAISRTLSISGQDNVTSSADVISVFAGAPVSFGSYVFQLNSSSYNGVSVGQNIPVGLSANVTSAPTPEPATMVLLATGVVGGLLVTRHLRASAFGL